MPLESHPAWSAGAVEAPQEVQVMVRVDEEDYVPSCVRLRARISDVLFTAELAVSDLESLQADPHVVSVSLPRGVTPAESGGEPD
jgi:hypothetical protein